MKNTIQISPYGVFEKIEQNGKRFVQICDAVAFAAVVADWIQRGRPKILLDYQHHRGEAAGWFVALRADPTEGLLGDVEYTPPGAKMVAEKLYRFTSADWSCGTDGRPFSLATVALTNNPNIPVRALSNSDDGTAAGNNKNPPQKENPKMEEIITLLGLPPETDEAGVVAALKALIAKNGDAEAAALKAKGEAVAVANAERIQNSADFVAAYIQAPDAVEAALKALKATPAPAATRVTNAAAGRPPAQVFATARKFADKAEARKALAEQPVGKRQAFYHEHQAEIEG